MGLWVTAIPGAYPVTGLLTGAVAQVAGGRAAFSLAGVALAIALIAGWDALAATSRASSSTATAEKSRTANEQGAAS